MAFFLVVFTSFEFVLFTLDRSSLSLFFSYLQLGKRGFFSLPKTDQEKATTPSAAVILPLWVTKKVQEKLLYSLIESGVPSLVYLPQIVRLYRHFFFIFSWGSVAFFSSPLQRMLR